jgi:hypothetical protein
MVARGAGAALIRRQHEAIPLYAWLSKTLEYRPPAN